MGQFFKQVISQVAVADQVVLVRVDYNLPLATDGTFSDDSRLRASLTTIQDLLERGAKQVILLSHLGRPQGPEPALSLEPIRFQLSRLLGLPVGFSQPTAEFAGSERVILCENLRFFPQEDANDPDFAQQLVTATGADLFVQAAFSVCHRATATTLAITKILPSYASQTLVDDYRAVSQFLPQAKAPVLAILGGAKLSDKIGFVESLIRQSDQIFIGGALAHLFLMASGKPIGASLVEVKQLNLAQNLLSLAKEQGKALFLPSDVKVQARENKLVEAVTSDDRILDLGDTSRGILKRLLIGAGAVIWNGTLGYTEDFQFRAGSSEIVKTLAELHTPALIGGGDTLAFVNQFEPALAYPGLVLSTGGGAMLDLIANGQLMAVNSLLDA